MATKGGKNKISNRLWLARKRRGFGQKQVAYLIGKTVDEVSRYERGVRVPELATLLALEIVYGLPIRMLFKELYEEVRAELVQRIQSKEALKNMYAEVLSSDYESSAHEFCTYNDLIRLPKLSPVEAARMRDHITRLAKKLAYL